MAVSLTSMTETIFLSTIAIALCAQKHGSARSMGKTENFSVVRESRWTHLLGPLPKWSPHTMKKILSWRVCASVEADTRVQSEVADHLNALIYDSLRVSVQ